jgi:hypothetical protein
VVLAYSILCEFSVVHDYNLHKLNFKISKLDVKDTTILDNKYGTLDENVLRSYSLDSLSSFIETNPLFMFKKHLDFSGYFDESRVRLIENEGILISGTANNFYQSKPPQDLVGHILKMIKENSQ